MIHPKKMQTAAEVASHYNQLDKFYRALWGEHVHHGFFQTGKETPLIAAQQLIDLVAREGLIREESAVCDVGCGYGAAARILSAKYGAHVKAMTISKAQWEYASKQGNGPEYILGDFLNSSLPSATFDTALSIESSEHMEDKPRFFEEIYRILKPGGRFIICVCLSTEAPKRWEIDWLLEPICRGVHLPNMGSETDYRFLMKRAGLEVLDFRDISKNVCKTASTRVKDFSKLKDRALAKTLLRTWIAYKSKSMRYGLFTVKKP